MASCFTVMPIVMDAVVQTPCEGLKSLQLIDTTINAAESFTAAQMRERTI
jgi:hypothetical protein